MYKKRSRITTAIWATLLLTAGFGWWHILPNSFRNQIEPVAHASTFTVNTADDHNDGVCNAADCSLREAINAVNAGAGGDVISFNIPGAGVHTINLTGGLPTLIRTVTIDGATPPSFSGTPLIELNGSGAGAGNVISGNDNTSFPAGVGVYITGGAGSQLQGNLIGTNPAGTSRIPNRFGILISGAPNNVIGGTTAAARNIVSGNTVLGIDILNAGATNNVVQGNYVGTDVTGSTALGNGNGVNGHGIEVGQ